MVVGRIRVVIAGNIYAKQALVRRFLEDDGFDVIGEVLTPGELLPAIRQGSPDAIVIDDELVTSSTMDRIRRAAPDAKIVMFTSSPPNEATAPSGADGYLEKGIGLGALTSLLSRLLTEPTEQLEPVAVGATATGVEAPGSDGAADTEVIQIGDVAEPNEEGSAAEEAEEAEEVLVLAGPRRTSEGAVLRLVSIAGGAILIAWGLVAMLTVGDGQAPTPVDRTDTTDNGGVIAAPSEGSLDRAFASLGRMIAAIEGSNYVLATVEAQTLMNDRARAQADGFSTASLDAEITTRLETVVDTIPARAIATLQGILGDLFPTLADVDEPGGGSDLVLGTTVTRSSGGSSSTGGDADGGGSQETTILGPGDGREWGQSHKENKGDGGPPPWATAKGHHK